MIPFGLSLVMTSDSRACQVSWMGTGTCGATFCWAASDQKLSGGGGGSGRCTCFCGLAKSRGRGHLPWVLQLAQGKVLLRDREVDEVLSDRVSRSYNDQLLLVTLMSAA